MESVLWLFAGLALLIGGGDLLVRGAVRVASRLGVSPMVIGLTLVAFGTSMPELVTSVQASLAGSPGIAIGNIVGSNIANLLLILGVAALLSPIAIQSRALRRDGGVVAATALLFAAATMFWTLDRLLGVAFLAALVIYVYVAFRQESVATDDHGAVHGRAQAAQGVDPGFTPTAGAGLLGSLALALGGLALILLGGRWLVDAAVSISRVIGVSEAVIGLTVVSVGTSAPELVTSVVAAVRKQADIAFGNVIGSNIYNILGIGGATALIAPTAAPLEIVWFDNPIMVAVTFLAFVFAATGLRIGRREGGVLLACYVVYVVVLFTRAA